MSKKGEKQGKVIVVKSKPMEVSEPQQQSVVMNPEVLMTEAIKNNASVETIERLLKMRSDLKAEWAKEQFDKAMAQFQADCPEIKKTKEVKTKTGQVAYRYAPIESVVRQVKKVMCDNGFSYKIQTKTDKMVKSTCIVKHIAGHSEDTDMEVPLGNKTQVMSDSQVVAAASTFSKRYAFQNAFGILTSEDDNDGRDMGSGKNAEKPKPTGNQDLEARALAQIELAKEKQDIDNLIKVDEYVQKHKFNKGFKSKVRKLINEAVAKIEKG